MTDPSRTPTEHRFDQLGADVIRSYAAGSLTWHNLRWRFGVDDFTIVLRGLAAQGLRLPRAAADRPTAARAWLREVLERAGTT